MIKKLLAFTLLAALFALQAEGAKPSTSEIAKTALPGVTRIELPAGSSVLIDAWGKCVTITNTIPGATILYIPVFRADAWKEFIRTKRDNIQVAVCE